MTATQATQNKSRGPDMSPEVMRKHAPHRVPRHVPPVAGSQKPESSACACGGGCPSCAPRPVFSSLVRSATEETGTPLSSGLAHRVQSRFHQTLPDIVTHRGARSEHAAQALNTRAFALGHEIFFGKSAPELEGPEGFDLLVHEVAHVLQQSGKSHHDPVLGEDAGLEQDAVQASRQSGPADITPDGRSEGKVQREDPPVPESLQRPFTSQEGFQMQLDPSIEFELFRMRLRMWTMMRTPESGQVGPVEGPESLTDQALDPSWISPDAISADPDVGALLAPFGERGVAAGAGDVELAQELFRDRYRFVLGLPDLRSIVPGFARSWVPSDWRVKVAEALTSMTIGNALSNDHPTAIEAADRMLLNITGDPGAVPTYINLPSISFDLF